MAIDTTPEWEIHGAELMAPQEPLRGRLTFSRGDRWFDFEFARERQFLARAHQGLSSITIETLELRVAWPSAQLLYPIGYFGGPDVWPQGAVQPPDGEERGVRFKARGLENTTAMGYPFVRLGIWKIRFDPKSAWVFIGDPNAVVERAASFADHCIAGLAHHQLIGLWLQPEFID